MKFYIFIKIGLFVFLLASKTAFADKALVDITFDFSNIAIAKDKDLGPPEGTKPSYSFHTSGFIYVKDSKMSLFKFSFPYSKMNKYMDEIGKKYKAGRRIRITYQIINYEPDNRIFSQSSPVFVNKDDGGYHLFDFEWYTEMLIFKYKKENGQWLEGFYRPESQYFEAPTVATITGYGDCPVVTASGWQIDLSKRLSFYNVNDLVKNPDYKIINVEYPSEMPFFVKLNAGELAGKKLTVTGKATLGDSAIRTEKSPFWYPLDKYSWKFVFASYYPADVSMHFNKVEDLDLSVSPNLLEFTMEANQKEERTVIFYREGWFKNIVWNIILAISPLFFHLFNTLQDRWNVKWRMRLPVYLLVGFATWYAIPVPPNVPRLNILPLATWLIVFVFIILLEVIPFVRSRKGKPQNSSADT